jgi:flavin reductase (DIM6/NTAB) family NADH-FMN oxidoreductase RutF
MTLDNRTFRRVMGQFATGVAIVTARSQAGIAGLTVNSFTSVSLDPLLILVCVDLRSQAIPYLREGGVFAVNILTKEQEELSNCFASASEKRYNYFCHANYTTATTGAPILEGSLAFIDARIVAEYPGGDHAIFLGRVEAAGYQGQAFFRDDVDSQQSTLTINDPASQNGHNAGEKQPAALLYYQGLYHHIDSHYHHPHPELAPAKKAQE